MFSKFLATINSQRQIFLVNSQDSEEFMRDFHNFADTTRHNLWTYHKMASLSRVFRTSKEKTHVSLPK